MRPYVPRLAMIALSFGAAAACAISNPPSGPTKELPYAVFYGRIGAPKGVIQINVSILAYKDSAHSIAGGDTGSSYAGALLQPAGDSNKFIAFVPAQAPGTYWIDIFATGQGHTGFEGSVDTIRGLKVRFDSALGGPHDSVSVYDSLP